MMKFKHAALFVLLLVVCALINVSCKPENSSKDFESPLDGASNTLKLDGTYPQISEEDLGIVGGVDVTIKKVPYQVSLVVNGKHDCGGSIINKDIILTAAHCISKPRKPSDVKIRAGSSIHKGGQIIQVKDFVSHQDYKSLDNDVGIILLSKSLQFSDSVKPIPMIKAGEEIPVGVLVTATGWGRTEKNKYPDNLKMVRIPIMSKKYCESWFPGLVTSKMICAGSSGKGTCDGDSGGAVVYNDKVVGVVSWGAEICSDGASPVVFAKVSALRDWIDKAIANFTTN